MATRTRDGAGHAHGRGRAGARAGGLAARRLFGRSLRLRSVVAGSCGGCEPDIAVLGTVVFDLARFGIQFVASPRHADGIVVTGVVNPNMRLALEKTWQAVPEPRLVIAVGACALSGGPFAGGPEAGTACPRTCRWTCACRAARRIRSRCSTGCCGCWAGSSAGSAEPCWLSSPSSSRSSPPTGG